MFALMGRMEKMEATEMMEKTAQMPATAMTVQMILTEPPV